MTITQFVLARIAEDEMVASATTAHQPYDHWDDVFGFPADTELAPGAIGLARGNASLPDLDVVSHGAHALEVLTHVARHDPARVLAECEAKRRIVELHGREMGGDVCDKRESYPCKTIRFLASVHADHPDYDEAWRPSAGP